MKFVRQMMQGTKRLRTSAKIEIGTTTVVIDTGPDFRQQMLVNKVKSLDAIVFTHEHKDHVAGLDDIRAYNYFQNKPMDIYANKDVEKALLRNYHYAFDPLVTSGVPKMRILNINRDPFVLGGVEWIPLPVMHAELEVLGFRIGDFAYLTDVNYISEETFDKLKGLKVLIDKCSKEILSITVILTLNEVSRSNRKAKSENSILDSYESFDWNA